MNDRICPRSPREVMAGWSHLPRLVDKIRLHLAGKLHSDYQENFGGGFDRLWLEAAGVDLATLTAVVRGSLTDGEVCDWILKNVGKSQAEKDAHRAALLKRGSEGEDLIARLAMRKQQSGLAHRDDIRTFVDYIDADEGRS